MQVARHLERARANRLGVMMATPARPISVVRMDASTLRFRRKRPAMTEIHAPRTLSALAVLAVGARIVVSARPTMSARCLMTVTAATAM